jgi:eukaryotic-like serine/threonine-protein kinase
VSAEAPGEVCPRCQRRFPTGRLGLCPACLLAPDPELSFGPDLELLEPVGAGGMANVYRAHDRRLNRDVAVKVLGEPVGDDGLSRARFFREARVLARLSHPHIVTIHAVVPGEHGTAIVMELMVQSLRDRLPVTIDDALRLALEVTGALEYAHAQGVVHRDLKPENILFDREGRAKVADFGIARLQETATATALTGAYVVVGTPGYMAPEMAGGAAPHPGMDLYALGVVLHEALTGSRPGDGGQLPAPLRPVVDRCLAVSPVARYSSARELRRDLEHAATALAAVGLATGPSSTGHGALPPDELMWLRAVAVVHTLATAVSLWAFVESVTPRVLTTSDMRPLVMLPLERLADGRLVSRARFETFPVLAAAAAAALAFGSHALLRRHWREAGLLLRTPSVAVPESRWVLVLGVIALVLFGARHLFASSDHLLLFNPLVGGVIEVLVLVQTWTALLQALRTGRPLQLEWKLWLGLGLALIPPAVSLQNYLSAWHP